MIRLLAAIGGQHFIGPPTNGLIGYWTFDAADVNWTTRAISDASGAGKHATANANMDSSNSVTGVKGNALKFNDGDDEEVVVNDGAAFDFGPTSAFSFSVWFKNSAALADIGYLLCKGTAANYGLYVNEPNSTISFWGNASIQRESSAVFIGQATFYHAVCTHDIDGAIQFYCNGVAAGGGTSTTFATGGAALRFGGRGGSVTTGSKFDGTLDEVMIYDRVLSAAEALQIYNAQKP